MQDLISRAPRPLMLLLTLAALLVTAMQVYAFWESVQQPVAGPVAPSRQTVERNTIPEIDLASVELFGTASPDEPAELDTENLPETNLRLVLRGVSAINAGESPRGRASALVEGPDRETDYYVVGASLPGNAALKAVYPDRIVLERQGTLENLYFPEEFETASFQAQGDRGASVAPTQPVARQAVDTGPSSSDEARKAEIRARLERLRERLRSSN